MKLHDFFVILVGNFVFSRILMSYLISHSLILNSTLYLTWTEFNLNQCQEVTGNFSWHYCFLTQDTFQINNFHKSKELCLHSFTYVLGFVDCWVTQPKNIFELSLSNLKRLNMASKQTSMVIYWKCIYIVCNHSLERI